MREKKQRTQLILVAIGLLLFALTYFYYPNMNKDKLSEGKSVKKDSEETIDKDQVTTFKNIEYRGLYDFDKPFLVESEDAYIVNDKPDIVFMNNMHVILNLSDGRILNIVSDKGRYNKVNYNCFFEQNVKATDGSTEIFADNLDLLANKNFAEIYNNVNLHYISGNLQADKIVYNFETKHFKVSMFDDKSIKMKVVR